MINKFDNFSKCSEVVVGDINFGLCELIEDKTQKEFVVEILDQTKKSIDDIIDIFKKFQIKVHRPVIIDNSVQSYSLPFFNLKAINHCFAPSDNFMTLANSIIEMSSINSMHYFDHLHYKHIFTESFEKGSRWLSMPRASYKPETDGFYEINNNREPLADAPSFLPFGTHIFHAESEVINKSALNWIMKEFPNFNYVKIPNTYGHLDSYVHICKPGVLLSGIEKDKLPVLFKNWKVIEFKKENYNDVKFISNHFQDNDYENTTLPINCFSIDSNNLLMTDHTIEQNPLLIKQIEDENINVISVKFDSAKWLNNGISCLCNSLVREGKFENYFN